MRTKLFGIVAGMTLALGVVAAVPGAALAAGGGNSGSGLDRGTEAARANDRTGGVLSGAPRHRYLHRHYRHHHRHYR